MLLSCKRFAFETLGPSFCALVADADRGLGSRRGSKMIVGVPRETKTDEYGVAMLPVGAEELDHAGHTGPDRSGRGAWERHRRRAVRACGARRWSPTPRPIWADADMIVKVKEPQPAEWKPLRAEQVVFTYFHFAADQELTHAIIDSGITAIAYETLA